MKFNSLKDQTSLLNVFKVALTDMRYFARSKFFGSLVPKGNFALT